MKKGKDDGNSAKNQRDLLNGFYHKHIDEFESISEYVDGGHTGTDISRENFQRLLADVMSGKINRVAVKDPSRFARNYSDAGSLTDNLFVQMGARFINPAENVDNFTNSGSVPSIIVPITSVMNDQYCYQTSKKTRQVFNYRRRSGQYIGSFAPYGYIKDPKDKHQLVVGPEAAGIIKLIYNTTLQGETRRATVYHLDGHGIPSLATYRRNKGLPYSCAVSNSPMWGDRVLKNILTNSIYTGDLVQGRRRAKSYKVHEIEVVPEEEWVQVADTREVVIDRETFDKVQALLKRDTRTAPRKAELHLLSGFLRCADCSKSITWSQGGKSVYCACSTCKYRSRVACSMHSIKYERPEIVVLFGIQYQAHLAVSHSEMIARINSAPVKKSQPSRLDDLTTAKEREPTKITCYKQFLYQDWKDGEITQQDYRNMKADYERQAAVLSDVLERLITERAELANGIDNEHPVLVVFIKYQNIETFNRKTLIELVDRIRVYENGNIKIKFKLTDELRKIAEYIETNASEIPAVAG